MAGDAPRPRRRRRRRCPSRGARAARWHERGGDVGVERVALGRCSWRGGTGSHPWTGRPGSTPAAAGRHGARRHAARRRRLGRRRHRTRRLRRSRQGHAQRRQGPRVLDRRRRRRRGLRPIDLASTRRRRHRSGHHAHVRPGGHLGRRAARFAWTVQDDAAATSECSLDDGLCSMRVCRAARLAEAEHVFRVRSTTSSATPRTRARRSVLRGDPGGAERRLRRRDAARAGVPVSVKTAGPPPSRASRRTTLGLLHGLSANWSCGSCSCRRPTAPWADWCASEIDATMAVYTGAPSTR